MLNEFWSTAPASYKVLVFGAMGTIAVGIILSIFGQVFKNEALVYTSFAVIGVGLVLHSAGVVIRGQKVQTGLRRQTDQRTEL